MGLFTLRNKKPGHFTPAATPTLTADQARSTLEQPYRISNYDISAQREGEKWIGIDDYAATVILEALPRTITTPGNLTGAQIRTQIQTYFEMVIDLIAIYMPSAALYGYAEANPSLNGYIRNYLANTGCKPWEMENMRTILRSLPMPPKLVEFCMQYYAVKQNPRLPNVHHFTPLVGSTAAESGTTVGINTSAVFSTIFTNVRDSITDYEEFINIILLGGYQQMEFPAAISPISDALSWEIEVNNSPRMNGYDGQVGAYTYYPTAGFNSRLLTVHEYVSDLGPAFARGLLPTYQFPQADAFDDSVYFANGQTGADDTKDAVLTSMGKHNFATDMVGGATGIISSRAGYLAWTSHHTWDPLPDGIPILSGCKGVPLPVTTPGFQDSQMARSILSNSNFWSFAKDAQEIDNGDVWDDAVLGKRAMSGGQALAKSSVINPTVHSINNGEVGPLEIEAESNAANYRQVTEFLMVP